LLQRAFTISNDAEIGAHLGEALWMNGQQEQARTIWQKALDHSPRGQNNQVLRNTLERLKVTF
jgi:predicted negative regulator of RcsB-dependent stress response